MIRSDTPTTTLLTESGGHLPPELPGRERGQFRVGAALAILLVSAISACGPAGPANTPSAGEASNSSSRADRTLVEAVRLEPTTLAQRAIQGAAFAAAAVVRRPFNADLAIVDGRGKPQPYIAQALPELHTDSWKVTAEGQMETTWKLKAGLIWHDGVPFSAQDIVVAWQVCKLPEFVGGL